MRKVLSFLILLLVVGVGIYLGYSDSSNLVVANDLFEMDGGIGIVIFMEAFCSIHMSIFVLFPIAGIINKNKVPQIFAILFLIRLIILIIGDIINPGAMAVIDFLCVFIGAFIVVPVLGGTKLMIFGGKKTYNEYVEVDARKLSQIGFSDGELLKRALIKQYIEIKDAYSNLDYHRLVELCTKVKYGLFKNDLKLLEQVGEKRIYKDFNVLDAKIYDCYMHKNIVDVSMILKVEFCTYVVDEYDKVKEGSMNNKETQMIEVVFHKKIEEDLITECPNCGSSISYGNVENCAYCGTTLNFRIGEWLLSSENIVRK